MRMVRSAGSGLGPNGRRRLRFALIVLGLGSVLGVFLIHPITMAIYWYEYRLDQASQWSSIWHFLSERMLASFSLPMLPMTLLFASLGALVSLVQGVVYAKLQRSKRAVARLEQAMARGVPTLIRLGENERVEFKSTLRWDVRQQKVNKALAAVIAKTLAAFANHRGGSPLIGVDDEGCVLGLEDDYRTLKKSDRDGFELLLMNNVRERLGGHVCRLMHVVFAEVEGKDVCRVEVEPATEPVYCELGEQSRFFVRTGNASRELDAREAVHFVSSRWSGVS
jgi:hypothetical protein